MTCVYCDLSVTTPLQQAKVEIVWWRCSILKPHREVFRVGGCECKCQIVMLKTVVSIPSPNQQNVVPYQKPNIASDNLPILWFRQEDLLHIELARDW